MDGKGKLKSRLILQVTQSCFFEGKRFTIPEGKKEGWGTGSTRCCFCADWQVFLHHGTWPRSQGWEELRCLHVFRQLWIPNKECCLMGSATSVLFWPAHSCHLIFFPSWYSPSFCTNESSTMEWCEWIFSVLSKSWDYQSWFSCHYSLLFEMLSQSKYLRWCQFTKWYLVRGKCQFSSWIVYITQQKYPRSTKSYGLSLRCSLFCQIYILYLWKAWKNMKTSSVKLIW